MSMIQNARFLLAFNQFTKSLGKDPMKQLLPSILALLAGAATIYTPQIQHLIAAHATISTTLVTLAGIVLHFIPAPSQQ